jgi:hypothetical protein
MSYLHKLIGLVFVVFVFMTYSANAETWELTNIKGYSARANSMPKYKYESDELTEKVLLTFNDDSGTASGTSTKFVRYGESTLVGVVVQEGFETVVVYQIDRQRDKVLISQSRMSKKLAEILIPNHVWSFVGDAKLIK